MSEVAMSDVAVLSRRSAPQTTPPSAGRILIIDDEAEIRESLEALLQLEGYTVTVAGTGREGLAQIGERAFDVVLLDLALPDKNGMDVLSEIRLLHAQQAVIMITAYGTVENAVRAMQSGATNFIQKPWDNEKLLADVRAAVARQKAEEENIQLKRALKQRYNFEHIVGKSEPMLKIFDLVAQVAPSRSTVLLQGESGTGKELIAKAIHLNSTRRDRPFVPVNSGSTPPDLLESTLFGHVKGAFTSAVASKKGLFEIADQGTIFLDEISTVGLETQAKLLRVIQEREFMRLGGTEVIKVDVRILAASNLDLMQHVREGRFREDLFHRLNVINLHLPPLRERREDVPALVETFLARYCAENNKGARRFSINAMKLMLDYGWPGNVRELENAVNRAVVLSTMEVMDVDLLPEVIRTREIVKGVRLQLSEFLPAENGSSPDKSAPSLFAIMEEIERRIILDMLERTSWNQTEAAERFQVPLSTLNQKIKRLGIEIRRRGPAAPKVPVN